MNEEEEKEEEDEKGQKGQEVERVQLRLIDPKNTNTHVHHEDMDRRAGLSAKSVTSLLDERRGHRGILRMRLFVFCNNVYSKE